MGYAAVRGDVLMTDKKRKSKVDIGLVLWSSNRRVNVALAGRVLRPGRRETITSIPFLWIGSIETHQRWRWPSRRHFKTSLPFSLIA